MNTSQYEIKQAIRNSKAEALRAQFPQLVSCAGVCGVVTAAKNIRIELKAAFPGVKFSVKISKFSMGNSINVSWIDGPTSDQVDKIIDKYEAGSFDGSTDSYTYSNSAWTDAFGDAKYISSSRSYSDELVGRVMNRVAVKFGTEPKTVEDYRQGRTWSWQSEGGCDLNRELNVALSRHTCSLARKLFAEPVQGEEPVIVSATGRTH